MATGQLGVDGFIDIAGALRGAFVAAIGQAELSVSAVGVVTDRANLLPTLGVAGDFAIGSAGRVGSLQVAAGVHTSLFDVTLFSLSGQFQLELNTTNATRTIPVLDVADDGTVSGVKSGAIAAHTLRLAGGVSLSVGPFSAGGSAEVVFSSIGFQLALDVGVDIGFGNVRFSGQAAIIDTASGLVFAANITTPAVKTSYLAVRVRTS